MLNFWIPHRYLPVTVETAQRIESDRFKRDSCNRYLQGTGVYAYCRWKVLSTGTRYRTVLQVRYRYSMMGAGPYRSRPDQSRSGQLASAGSSAILGETNQSLDPRQTNKQTNNKGLKGV